MRLPSVPATVAGFGLVAEKMKAIGDLQCIWGAFPRTLGVGTHAADDFHSRVLLERRFQTLRLSIRQKIDRPAAFQVDPDCSTALTLFPCPVIDAKNFDEPKSGLGPRFNFRRIVSGLESMPSSGAS
jgi:hypothetical protein